MSVLTPLQRYEFRKIRTRSRVAGTAERPRLTICRTSKHIYAQVIDDVKGHTVAAASSLDAEILQSLKRGSNVAAAKAVGSLVAKRAKSAGIAKVVFDRGGRPYHGRIKAVADGARDAGLEF
jgi:large subunit ribosomal protein L18